MVAEQVADIATAARGVRTSADLARLLRALRRREARGRLGPEYTYREIADRTGWSVAVIGAYFRGTKLASTERFDGLIQLLGATGPELGALATARDEVAATRSVQPASGEPPAGGVPHTLPPRVLGFTGRTAQLAHLDQLLSLVAEPGAVVISAVAGMGGIGKTALAVHWAHRVAEHFPDGDLYLNLRGFDPDEPLTVLAALGTLLGGLGVDPSSLPPELDERQALYRKLLQHRRVLVLLDNASGSAQVRPLLPPAPCLALVTSRDDLAELISTNHARRIVVDALTPIDAVALLRLLIGERAELEPDAAATLAELCGHIPLALRVAAEHVVASPQATLAELVDEFRAERTDGGLGAFTTTGDTRTDMRAVFSWSVRRLSEPAARAFRLLGLVPGSDVDLCGLAALAGIDLSEARALADTLARAHLIEFTGGGRISMHDLLRAYAAESCVDSVGAADRSAAVTRLLDFYLATSTRAVGTKFVYNTPLADHVTMAAPFDGAMPEVGDIQSAGAWLATERPNLVRACVHAAREGWPEHAVALALTLRPFLDDGHDHDGLVVHGEALAAAERSGDGGDPISPPRLRTSLAISNSRLSRNAVAAELARRAFDEQQANGDQVGAALSLAVLAASRLGQGLYREAVVLTLKGLEIARSTGNRTMEANQLYNLGNHYQALDEYEIAADYYGQASAAYREAAADHADELDAAHDFGRGVLADALAGMGRLDEAMLLAEWAAEVEFSNGNTRDGLASTTTLGTIYRRLGRLADALDVLTGALEICGAIENPSLTVRVFNALGETHRDGGDLAQAIAFHRQAHELAARVGDPLDVARSLVGLGDALAAAGDTGQADECWREALEVYRRLGVASAGAVADRLARVAR